MRAGLGILAVAGAVDPVALARLVLDPEIVPHRDQLGVALPPLAEDPLRARPRAAPAGGRRAR